MRVYHPVVSVTAASLSDLEVAQMLPDADLPRQDGGPPVSLRPPRGETTVILWRHPAGCRECDRYVHDIEGIEEEFRVWDARLVVVVSSRSGAVQPPWFGMVGVDDRLTAQSAGVIVADRYGQVFHAVRADLTHGFPSARELAEWLKYLGTLCPE